jgi:hypothetical protein
METPAQKAAADAAVDAMLSAYQRGMLLVFATGPIADSNAAAGMEELRPRITRWASVYRRWAGAGRRDDGSAYSWARWEDYGHELESAIRIHSGVILAGIAWPVDAAVQSARDAGTVLLTNLGARVKDLIANPWPWWAKAGLGAGAVIGVLAVLSPYARFIPGGR